MQVRLSGKWTEHLQGEEKSKFIELILMDREVLGRLYSIIEDFENSVDQADLSIDEYDSPAFPYLKAHRNGERSILRKIKSLLSHIKE